MARTLRIAIIQAAFGEDMTANIGKVETFARAAAKDGAQVVLAPELFRALIFVRRKIRSISRLLFQLITIRS